MSNWNITNFILTLYYKFRGVSSVGLERLLDRQEVTGSNPVHPTSNRNPLLPEWIFVFERYHNFVVCITKKQKEQLCSRCDFYLQEWSEMDHVSNPVHPTYIPLRGL